MKKRKRPQWKRIAAAAMAGAITLTTILPGFPTAIFAANIGDTITAYGDGFHYYCIDGYGSNNALIKGDEYQFILPSQTLSSEEIAVVFWAMLSLQASFKNVQAINSIVDRINSMAPAENLPQIKPVTEEDLKKIIHVASVKAKYPWLNQAVANAEKYMQMAGLLATGGGNGAAGSGKIPTVLQGHGSAATALAVDKNTFTIQFDAGGADADFIAKVPLKFSDTGADGSFKDQPMGGWRYVKTSSSIIFSNPNPQPQKLFIEFDTKGTPYESSDGYSSPEDMYEKCLQVLSCVKCAGTHKQNYKGAAPTEMHQRLVFVDVNYNPSNYYASIAGDPVPGVSSGDLEFKVYRHEEDITSTYNVQLYKYDHETGKPLEDASFDLYERFDDQNVINKERDGAVEIYEGGEPYKSYHTDNPVTWDDFRFVSSIFTDGNGHAQKTINHGYHYDKTFCDGHPAPPFVSVPEEEEDEETGEIENEEEIEAAQEENQKLAMTWLDCFAACEEKSQGDFSGVHFHWLMPSVDKGEIERISGSGGSPGETPNAGTTTSASGDVSFRESGCQADMNATYEKFISLKYSYALQEKTARSGYILHGTHSDDLPIEVITTDASENGANAEFAGEYGRGITTQSVSLDSAREVLAQRAQIAAYRMEEESEEIPAPEHVEKKKESIWQKIIRFFLPKTSDDDEEMEDQDEDLIDDLDEPVGMEISLATSSNSSGKKATASNLIASLSFTKEHDQESENTGISVYASRAGSSSELFVGAYNTALSDTSSGANVTPGPDDNYSHCNGADHEGDAWRIYDHRTEGEIHINKRDMDLEAGESEAYDSYAQGQADTTLEGAVYGLFAAKDIVHPDGKSGVIYKANNLVSVATTDRDGNASFMTNTEAPGYGYDYEQGSIVQTKDGWAQAAPGNLYQADTRYDDYTEDGDYERQYYNNAAKNGNCWIGRPLFMGEYYVKELSRSEGYELSVGNRENSYTNRGQDYDVAAAEDGNGYAGISRTMFAEEQISDTATGDYNDPDYNEVFFEAESQGRGQSGFDLRFQNIPKGARLYRLDTTIQDMTVEVGTGVYEEVAVKDAFGLPVYVRAETDYQYPKYNADGSLMMQDRSVNTSLTYASSVERKGLNEQKTQDALLAAEDGMSAETVQTRLASAFTETDKNFVKGKLERALRVNGKRTPYTTSGGKNDYSGIYVGVYDAGVREGERDPYGVAGGAPGSIADKTVYGSPVLQVAVDKTDENGNAVTVGSILASLLDFYNTNDMYNYGGLDDISEDADQYVFTIYASRYGNPDGFFVPDGFQGDDEGTAYKRVEYLPDDPDESPRYIYADYGSGADAFGTYENAEVKEISGSWFFSAVLVPDASADGSGNLRTKTEKENVFYKTGEIPCDKNGNPIQKVEYREKTTTSTIPVQVGRYVEIPMTFRDGYMVAHVESRYTDSYGTAHDDADMQDYRFKIVLPEKWETLTAEDIQAMKGSGNWSAGDQMGSAAYYLRAKSANVKAYLDYNNRMLGGAGSFIKDAELVYPGQGQVMQDGGTGKEPVRVSERPIRQRIKVIKDIQTNPDGSYAHNTYDYDEVKKAANFRFKAYLKSNLERLYRAEDGSITWLDRNGNEISYDQMEKSSFPDVNKEHDGQIEKTNVEKIFTKVLHDTSSNLTSMNANNVLAAYQDPETAQEQAALKNPCTTAIAPKGIGVLVNAALYSFRGKNTNVAGNSKLRADQNAGYTRILETVDRIVESGTGTITVQEYNYDKFFDAMEVANTDKWDDQNQTYTSWKPIGNAGNRSDYAVNNAKASDMVRQFAITWYLDDEVAKLVQDNSQSEDQVKADETGNRYAQEVYDEALNNALSKAYNYLKPFFAYDLDEIYSIPWDQAKNGGTDQDRTTLSADSDGTDYFYGLSSYLPYGTYVVVEQQPKYVGKNQDAFNDFVNKHYKTDRPKEIMVPTLYEDGSNTNEVAAYHEHYKYDAAASLQEQAKAENYLIRFGEEWNQNGGDQRGYVIRAHNHDGNFEVYKYGLEPDKLTGTIRYAGGSYTYKGFGITQEAYDPLKDYYNPIHEVEDRPLTAKEGANENSHYYADDDNQNLRADGGGRYEENAIEKRYHYASVSEQAGNAKNIRYDLASNATKDNAAGALYRNVAAMQGIQTAYAGLYAPMLVPYSVVDPAEEKVYDAAQFAGYADGKYRNMPYAAKLRIEKLDAETHEHILHDSAIFMIYQAQRDKKTGSVLFYDHDTTITGTKEFLKAMNASDVRPVGKKSTVGVGELYSGLVKAGTPICAEEDKVVLSDDLGNDVGQFEAFSTTVDVSMKNEDTNQAPNEYRRQSAGYLETPEPLGAGVYVLAEVPPSGYVRTAPIAIEIYSDKVSYYKEGSKDVRVHAAIYEESPEGAEGNLNKPQDRADVAQIYVENTPIKLQVEKIKKTGTVTFRIGTRIEGSMAEIGGNDNLEYAYSNGQYLGYAWEKGTLETLQALKEAGELVEIVYNQGQFAGYGYITRTRDTDDDVNPYVVGAKLTLFDAIELTPSGDSEDHAFDGLQINRSNSGNVLEMFVKQGYAGQKTEMVKETDENGKEILTDYVVGVDENGQAMTKKGYTWKEGTVERPDTDILYYDLDSLSLTWTETVDNRKILYGWDKDHKKVSIAQIESDKVNYKKSDLEPSIYAFQGGQAVFEFVGGDFTKLSFDSRNKILNGDFAPLQFVRKLQAWKQGEGTVVYHLDRYGNRDSLVDPYTGMAYVLEPVSDAFGNHVADRILVWPVNIRKDEYGNIIARDKITTSRIATIGENQDGYGEQERLDPVNQNPDGQTIPDSEKPGYEHQESGYINGTWKSEGGEESHRETSEKTNKNGQNMNGEVLVDENNGDFLKFMSPVYDVHGLVLYYQRSEETYDKGSELYDRNGDFVRYQDSDNLEEYNKAAYALDEHDDLYDGRQEKESQVQDRLYHRKGESYILENTWLTSDKTPNDPFSDQETDGQADLLKRLPAGTYILEELAVAEGKGYVKAVPVGVTVDESKEIRQVSMKDDTTKIYLNKLDAPKTARTDILNMGLIDKNGEYQKTGVTENQAVEYSYGAVTGAEIALYPAAYKADLSKPDGYRLDKTSDQPFVFASTNSTASVPEAITASWRTDDSPVYVEGIPTGYYILEETRVPEDQGFVKADPVYVEITAEQEIQPITMKDDHTKVAIWKYTDRGGMKETLPGAEFALYEAERNPDGTVKMQDGLPQYDQTKLVDSWISGDASDYTKSINLKDYANTTGKNQITGFTAELEAMYAAHGIRSTGFGWSVERTATRLQADANVWMLQDGSRIVTATDNVTFPASLSKEDRDGFKAAYAAMIGNKTTLKWAVSRTATIEKAEAVDTDAGGVARKYPASANLTIKIPETGKTVLVNARYDGKNFTYSYKFDYQKLAVNQNANSWLMADGSHRLDYLPVGSQYVLVETKAPEGYALATPRIIKVEGRSEVQLHEVANEKSALLIAKISAETKKALSGNELALYKADPDGNLIREDSYLVETWISGNDGTYTEKDAINGLIPAGFLEGDLKPHYLYNLADGDYYLVEMQAKEYYRAFEPMKIHYTAGDRIQVVTAENEQATGKLIIHKKNNQGGSLQGVVFELNAYDVDGKLVDGFPKQISDINGIVTASGLPVGTVQPDGSVLAYTYKFRELVPPTGYAVNNQVYTFSFESGKDSYGKDPTASFAIQEFDVVNDKTRISITKRNLTKLGDTGIDGIFVDGAVLALYKVTSVSSDGSYTYRAEDLFDQWTSSSAEGAHILVGVVAGQSYVLVEKQAPKGYNLMKPVLLTISADGRKISDISNRLTLIQVQTIQNEIGNPDTDSISALTVSGRTALRTEIVVSDQDGTEVLRFTGTDEDHILTSKDGLVEGKVYTFAEHTIYSDGSDVITKKLTRVARDTDTVGMTYPGRSVDHVKLQIRESSGTDLFEFIPKDGEMEQTVENGLRPEIPAITVKNRNGAVGEALEADQPVISTIAYYNADSRINTIQVKAVVDPSMTITDAFDGKQHGNTITWTIENVKPYSQGFVSFASMADRNTDSVFVKADVNVSGQIFETKKTVPVLKRNHLTIYNELTGSGKELFQDQESVFQVRLWDERGTELAGSYVYAGSKKGVIRSGESISLSGNEFITIDPDVFKNCRYEVVRKSAGMDINEHETTGTISEEGSCAWFTRYAEDTSSRQIFEKGKTYILSETTEYSDGESRISNQFSFTLDQNAGITSIGGYDQITKISVSKTDFTTGEELPGNKLEIIDEDGHVIDSWISGDKPHEIEGLEPGKSYTLRETSPKDGYGYAEDITFTVNQDGTVDQVLMENKPTHLVVSKKDITNEEELPGAKLTILDQDGHVIDSWISGDKPHEIIGKLIADRSYTLREEIPAPGFVIANDIVFTISHDGSVDYVTMKDDTTKVHIHKNKTLASPSNASEPLAGAVLQVLNMDKTPAMYHGREITITTGTQYADLEKMLVAGEQYWLRELKPASGYAYAADILFTVSTDGSVDDVLMEDRPTDVTLSKKAITGSEELPGNKMQVIDKETGEVIDQWISGKEAHRITGKLEADHTYILREAKPADGYSYAEDIVFTVSHDGTPDFVEMRDDVTKVAILKVDAGNKKILPGAKFEILDQDGKVVESWTSTEAAHRIEGKLIAGETYVLREVEAPAGYKKMEDVTFRTNLNGDVLTIQAENTKKGNPGTPGKPGKPEVPTVPQKPEEPVPGKGKITASYDYRLGKNGKFELTYDGSEIDLTVKTGDDFPYVFLIMVFISSAIGCAVGVVMYMKTRKKENGQKWPPKGKAGGSRGKFLFLGILVLACSLVWQVKSYAALEETDPDTGKVQYLDKIYITDTDDPKEQHPDFQDSMSVHGKTYVLDSISYEVESKKKVEPSTGVIKVTTSAPFTDGAENHLPEEELDDEKTGTHYYLKSYEVIKTKMDAREEPVSDTIPYTEVPAGATIPQSAKISVKDDLTGKQVAVSVPLASEERGSEYWISGFSFPIKASGYDSQIFDLNGQDVPLSEDKPLSGYENELLDMIGVSAEHYQIDQIEWNGPAYQEDGVTCRNLTATGRMLVYDCEATYSGVVNLPEVDAQAIQAVYTDRQPSETEEEPAYTYTMKATAKYTNVTEPLGKKTFLDHLIDFITNPVVVATLLFLLLLVLIIWLIQKKKKEKESFLYLPDEDSEDEDG